MQRSTATILTFGLLMLALGAAGILSSGTGLLMVAPFLVLLLPMLAGRYPGEAALEALVRFLDRARRFPAGAPAPDWISLPWSLLSGCAGGPNGPRAPPMPIS